ncbi:hypothetical protein [Chondromyces apiculatus]|uniref:Uncharacterized protein n=1 Tax=Chondromyces apiculatus DSM 436 TaxID=1192034 RepID=A0A017TA99_9BACT|nr:hypothetical protein [Chondromyces apiculatus]EYF05755.1 Hypothetical protein CAP_3045 [Chondromyces apiculatus DSM 436]
MLRGAAGKVLDHVHGRGALALLVGGVAIAARFGMPAPPPRTADAVAAMLGGAVGGTVGVDDFVWEERGGFLRDALLGRRVLFLAATTGPEGQRSADLYRATVRLTRSGRPLWLHTVRNLSETPLGDERGLVARGRRAAFVSVTPGVGVQHLTLLDLAGEAPASPTRFGRVLEAVEGFLSAGTWQGVGRTEVAFGAPPPEAVVDLTDTLLLAGLGPERTPMAVELGGHQLNTGGKEAYQPSVQVVARPSRSWVEVVTMAARRLLGPEEAQSVERAAIDVERWLSAPAPEPGLAGQAATAAGGAMSAGGGWPPGPLATVISPALTGEGVWVVADGPFVKGGTGGVGGTGAPEGTPGGVEPWFYATYLRPDLRLPEARVQLLAIDTRRIELRFQAGYDAPRPEAGPRGTGRLPRAGVARAGAQGGAADAAAAGEGASRGIEAGSASRVLGAVALGADGSHGMMVDGRAVVAPRAGLPTVAVDQHGRALVGAWPSEGGASAGIRALFQGDPLPSAVGAGVGAGGGEGARGWDDDVVTERAALCLTAGGYLVHAWGRAVDAPALSRALTVAGCKESLQVGRHPARLGFAWVGEREGAWAAERLSPVMSLVPEQITSSSPGAFAYLVQRDPAPPVQPRRAAWSVDGATQPGPASVPAVHAAEVLNLGARVKLTAFSPDRFELRLRAGAREISPRGAPKLPEALTPEEHARALGAVGFGIGRRRGALGLSIDGKVGLRFRGEGGQLVVHGRRVEILPAGVALPPGAAATELPLVAEGGKLLPSAREIGAMRRRGAACVLEDGTFVVATTTFDSDEATTEALLDLGCGRVVAFDRGARRSSFLHRAGALPAPAPAREEPAEATDPSAPTTPPEPTEPAEPTDAAAAPDAAPVAPPELELPPVLRASYDDTTLFLLEAPMLGRARPFTGW